LYNQTVQHYANHPMPSIKPTPQYLQLSAAYVCYKWEN